MLMPLKHPMFGEMELSQCAWCCPYHEVFIGMHHCCHPSEVTDINTVGKILFEEECRHGQFPPDCPLREEQ